MLRALILAAVALVQPTEPLAATSCAADACQRRSIRVLPGDYACGEIYCGDINTFGGHVRMKYAGDYAADLRRMNISHYGEGATSSFVEHREALWLLADDAADDDDDARTARGEMRPAHGPC